VWAKKRRVHSFEESLNGDAVNTGRGYLKGNRVVNEVFVGFMLKVFGTTGELTAGGVHCHLARIEALR